jgi:hypothetical protein
VTGATPVSGAPTGTTPTCVGVADGTALGSPEPEPPARVGVGVGAADGTALGSPDPDPPAATAGPAAASTAAKVRATAAATLVRINSFFLLSPPASPKGDTSGLLSRPAEETTHAEVLL